jgi:hypothetical protein
MIRLAHQYDANVFGGFLDICICKLKELLLATKGLFVGGTHVLVIGIKIEEKCITFRFYLFIFKYNIVCNQIINE